MSANEKLSTLNYLNVVFYAINVFATYGVGVLGLFNLPTNSELSAKYQTLVTPIGWAFSIWGPIFILEAVFAIMQLTPKYRSHPIVLNGVSYWYCIVVIAQAGWTFSFCFEIIWLSFLMMLSILASLCIIIYQTRNNVQVETTIGDFWLLKFPFELHAGWIIAASAVNLSVCLVAYRDDITLQISVAVLSVTALVVVSLAMLFSLKAPVYTLPTVQAWALLGVSVQLASPLQETAEKFSFFCDGLGLSAKIASVFIVVLVLVRAADQFYSGNKVRSDTRGGEDMLEENLIS